MGIFSRLTERRDSVRHSSDADSELRAEEVAGRGGTYGGLLFDNPSIGLAPSLTWSFDFDCVDAVRDGEPTPIGVTVEWLPLPASSWQSLSPHRAAGRRFAGPAEASVYFYEHHRFDAFDLVLQEQRPRALLAVVTLHGDLDGLGLEPVTVTAWLRFTGFRVQLSDVSTPSDAMERLASMTDTQGLVLTSSRSGSAYQFEPARG